MRIPQVHISWSVFFILSLHIFYVHVHRYLPATADFLSNYEFLGQNTMILKDARGHEVCTKLSVFPSVKFTKIATKGPLEVLKVDGVL